MTGLDGFLLFLAVGFLAQLVDGALGMAYGVICSSALLAFGAPPAAVSASVHAAKLFTTASSAASHMWLRNVAWRVFLPLVIGGTIGAVIGAYVLTGINGRLVRPLIVAYLGLIGLYILYRAWGNAESRAHLPPILTGPLGLLGGFLDSMGGGGWGPTVTSATMGAGLEARKAIGTTNAAEFLISVAASATFLWALVTGRSEDLSDMRHYLTAVGGLVVGGLIAAPFAGLVTKRVKPRTLTFVVGVLIIGLAIYQGARLALT